MLSAPRILGDHIAFHHFDAPIRMRPAPRTESALRKVPLLVRLGGWVAEIRVKLNAAPLNRSTYYGYEVCPRPGAACPARLRDS
jgi:hypothetical protein